MSAEQKCRTKGCGGKVLAKGWCSRCYYADYRGSKPRPPRAEPPISVDVVLNVGMPDHLARLVRAAAGDNVAGWMRSAAQEKLRRESGE